MFLSFPGLRRLPCGGPAKPRASHVPAKNGKIRLQVEALEERAVPTILFMPHFGPETMAAGSANAGTQHPTVNLVFAGPFWTTQTGQQDQATIINSTKSILSGPYLSGLTEYGSDGKAVFGQFWNDPHTLPNNPSQAALQAFLQNSIGGHSDPGSGDYRHAPIYVVISDPHFSANSGGNNTPGTYVSFGWHGGFWLPQLENINMVHIGTRTGSDGHVIKDWFTMTESHELAEVMSDPGNHGAHFNPPAGMPLGNLGNQNQIADNEPELGHEHYGYRLGGDLVQPYWSDRNQAFIVPDSNSQNFYLTPIWNAITNPSDPGASFTGKFNLRVGDQLAVNYSSHIAIGGTANVSVTMNNQSAVFEQGSISSINVNTASGSNKVDVYGLPQGVALNIDSTGLDSNDTVVIGAGGSLAGIQGTVNVANHSGHTSLVIEDTLDGARNTTITDHSVAFAGLTTVNYDEGYMTSGSKHGVTSLALHAGAGSRINVLSVGALTDTDLFVYWEPWPWNTVYGPAASQVHVHTIWPVAY